MTTEIQARSGFLGFLTTLPGILTALAALVTAVGGVFLYQGERTDPAPLPPVPVPVPTESIDPALLDPIVIDDDIRVDDVVDQLIDECAAGYLDSCSYLVDQLVLGCSEGDALSCDDIYWLSPEGSWYEAYGATCGGRFDWDYAVGACDAL